MITESLQGKPNSHRKTIHPTDKTPGAARDRVGDTGLGERTGPRAAWG